jgi:hypothetical protein
MIAIVAPSATIVAAWPHTMPWMAAMTGVGPSRFVEKVDRPLIVGGCPRSGTTLLRSMLHSHPEMAMPRETRFVIEAWQRRRAFGDLREAANRRRLAAWIFDRPQSLHRRFGLDHDLAVEQLVAAPPTLGSILATPFLLYSEKHGKPRWGDKRPKYASRMVVVWDLFPAAQFVHIVRDPRACVASMRKLGWFEGRIAPAIEMWEHSINTVAAWRARLAPDQLLEVAYEDLVTEPDRVLARLAAFSRLAADGDAVGRMLRYHERKEVRSERYHANLASPPDPTRASSWTTVLDPDEIALVERATGPLMATFGYEPVAEGVTPSAGLRRSLWVERRRRQAARLELSLRDRARKLLSNGQPLAAVTAER